MRVLYVAFVLSLAVLLWTAIAVARYIRRHSAQGERQAEIPEMPEEILKESSPRESTEKVL